MTDAHHKWQPRRTVTGLDQPDGNDRTERICLRCGFVKITVHSPSGLPWREWRTRNGGVMIGERTPRCRPIEELESA